MDLKVVSGGTAEDGLPVPAGEVRVTAPVRCVHVTGGQRSATTQLTPNWSCTEAEDGLGG